MKLSPMIIGGVIITVLAVGGGVYYVTTQNNEGGSTSTTQVSTGDSADIGNTKEACELFTLEIAKTVLGEDATKAELPAGAQTSNDDISVSNCLYEANTSMTVSVLVRGAKTAAGKDSNRFGFEGNEDGSNFEDAGVKYSETEQINGLGDAAFYSPDFKQVNVLADDGKYWLIIQGETREQSEQLAKLLVENI